MLTHRNAPIAEKVYVYVSVNCFESKFWRRRRRRRWQCCHINWSKFHGNHHLKIFFFFNLTHIRILLMFRNSKDAYNFTDLFYTPIFQIFERRRYHHNKNKHVYIFPFHMYFCFVSFCFEIYA